MHESGKPIAVVDDEVSVRRALRRLMVAAGYTVQTFATGHSFIDAAATTGFACVLLDVHMPQTTGFDVQTMIAQHGLDLPVIIITGHDTPEARQCAIAAGASAYLCKPVDDTTLLAAIESAIPRGPTPGTPDRDDTGAA